MLVFGGLFSLGKTEKNANKEKEKKSKKKIMLLTIQTLKNKDNKTFILYF